MLTAHCSLLIHCNLILALAVLPHLKSLVEIIEHGLQDEQSKVRCITALALAALAEAAAPYGEV